MTSERIQPTDRPTQVLQHLDSKEFCLRLTTANKDKDALLQGLGHNISDFTSLEKISLVKRIFTNLSKLDTAGEKQDQRDAGLEVLRLVDLTSLTPQESNSIAMHYVKTVSKLDRDYDPLGEIDALLEAGNILAPSIPTNHNTYKRYIVSVWKNVASEFGEDDKNYILNKSEKIKKNIPSSIYNSSKYNSSKHSEFDQQIEQLARQDLSNKNIAEILQAPDIEITRAIHRLRKRGITFSRPKDKRLSEQQKQIDLRVRELRNKGIGNSAIARELDISVSKVNSVTRLLSQKGEIKPLKRGRRKNEE